MSKTVRVRMPAHSTHIPPCKEEGFNTRLMPGGVRHDYGVSTIRGLDILDLQNLPGRMGVEGGGGVVARKKSSLLPILPPLCNKPNFEKASLEMNTFRD